MSATIELMHNQMLEKISKQRLLVEQISQFGDTFNNTSAALPTSFHGRFTDIMSMLRAQILLHDLDDIEKRYKMSTVGVLSMYYSIESSSTNEVQNSHTSTVDIESELHMRYFRIITSENYDSQLQAIHTHLDTILRNIRSLFEETGVSKRTKSGKLFDLAIESAMHLSVRIRAINTNPDAKKLDYDKCMQCGETMEINSSQSQMKCYKCGRIYRLVGTVFADKQNYGGTSGATKTSKHGGYNPNRHFRFWINRILARENKVFPQGDLDKIRYVITRDGDVTINCIRMRRILQEVKLTKYNSHCSLLIKLFTGVSPPQPTFNELRVISIKFNKIMDIFEQIKTNEDHRAYYPYWIYKIIEWDFRALPDKIKILDYIYLQSEDTLAERDQTFEEICLRAKPEDDLHYSPTIIGM